MKYLKYIKYFTLIISANFLLSAGNCSVIASRSSLNNSYNDSVICNINIHEYVLTAVDNDTSNIVFANIGIFRYSAAGNSNAIYKEDSVSNCSILLNSRETYFLQVSAEGYLNLTLELTFSPDIKDTTISLLLQKIQTGRNFNIENIFFYGNLSKFLPSSTPALEHLLRFMQRNHTVNIEIQGHVNFPANYGIATKTQDDFNIRLSEERAKAVYTYLLRNGIHKDRLEYKGYGSSQMIYPEAKSPREYQLNRRVGIVVTSY